LDEQEFEAFFAAEYPGLVRHVVAQGYRPEQAVDAAEDAMTQLLISPDVQNPRAWLRVTARRTAQRASQRDRRRAELSVQAAMMPAPPPPGPEAHINHKSEVRKVVEALHGLPPMQRRVMAYFLDGYRPAEIAVELGVARATVDSHLRHARKALKAAQAANGQGREE